MQYEHQDYGDHRDQNNPKHGDDPARNLALGRKPVFQQRAGTALRRRCPGEAVAARGGGHGRRRYTGQGRDVAPTPSPAATPCSPGTGSGSSRSPAGCARGTTRVASLSGGAPTPTGATTGGADSGLAATGGADNGLGVTGGGAGMDGAPVA